MPVNQYMRGYTLIEVLVAMTILAMSLTVLFRIFSTGLNNAGISADYARAVIIAETQLAEAGVLDSLVPGEIIGAVDERFYWTRTIEDYVPFENFSAEVSPVAAYQITVAVEWRNSGRSREISLSSIRLDRGVHRGNTT